MAYEPQEWRNGPSGGTPISAERLTHIEQGIADAHEVDVKWDAVGDKPAVIAAGETEQAAREAIGAGTSSQELAAGTAQLLETGANTEQRSWSAKMIHDEIARQVAAALADAGE